MMEACGYLVPNLWETFFFLAELEQKDCRTITAILY